MDVKTPNYFNHFDQIWRSVTIQQYFTFRVKSCSDCHVGLAPTLGVDYGETYLDLVISGWNNQRSQFILAKGMRSLLAKGIGKLAKGKQLIRQK